MLACIIGMYFHCGDFEMHNEHHPNSGKFFWLNLRGTQCLPSPEDLKMPFRLLDWADRLDSLENYSLQQKEYAIHTYKRRMLTVSPSNEGEILVGQLRGGVLLLIHESELGHQA